MRRRARRHSANGCSTALARHSSAPQSPSTRLSKSHPAGAGDYLGSFKALRDLLAESLESYESKRDLAASSRLPSASAFVVGLSVVLATARNRLPAERAQGAALLMSGDRIGQH